MKILLIVQAVISILLVVVVLMQNRGEGLDILGGSFNGSYHTKRGFEKFLTRSTVVLAILFVGVAITIVKIGI